VNESRGFPLLSEHLKASEEQKTISYLRLFTHLCVWIAVEASFICADVIGSESSSLSRHSKRY